MATLLVIDDEALVLKQLVAMLKAHFPDSRVLKAAGGAEGLAQARAQPPDLVLLDVSLPDADGFEVCRQLKAEPAFQDMPVLMISGVRKDGASLNQALDAGADDFLCKPFSADELYFRVKAMLRLRRTEMALRRQKTEIEAQLAERNVELRESERQFRELAEFLPDVILEADLELNVRYLNRAGRELFGYAESDLKQPVSLRRLIVFTARQAEEHIRQVLQGETVAAREYLAVKRDGMRFIARINFGRIVASGSAGGLRGVLIDITEFKQLQQELIESREKMRALFSNMFDGFAVWEAVTDAAGTVTDCLLLDVNPAFEQLVGRPARELLGHTLLEILPGTEAQWIQTFGDVARNGSTTRFERYFGELGRHFQVSAFSPRRGVVAILLMDITSRKINAEKERELREKTQRAKHLELMAAMAGGVAHELNNILGPLICYPDLILMELPETASCREDVITIRTAAKRAVTIVEDMLVLGRSGMFKKDPLDLCQLVSTSLKGQDAIDLRGMYPEVRVRFRPRPGLASMLGYAPHCTRIVVNLVRYGCEILEGKGRICLYVAEHHFARAVEGYSRTIPPGVYLGLHVTVRKKCLDPEDQKGLFEPFRKTRFAAGRRVGLGLTLVHSVVHNHDGYIQVTVHPRVGTRFSMYLPPAQSTVAPAVRAVGDLHGTESLLIVDDMQTQRDMASKLLGSLGYRVTTVRTGREALALLEARRGAKGDQADLRFDLVVLDMMLEDDFDGLDTYQGILLLNPRQKCIIASGFAKSERVQAAESLGLRDFVRKPYTLESIGQAVRRALDGG